MDHNNQLFAGGETRCTTLASLKGSKVLFQQAKREEMREIANQKSSVFMDLDRKSFSQNHRVQLCAVHSQKTIIFKTVSDERDACGKQ